MKRLPSTSHTCAPAPRATKYGVPPTEPKARTGEFTPPGITRCARSKRSRLVDATGFASSAQQLRQLPGEVGEDDVGPGTLDRSELLDSRRRPIDPTPLCGCLDHRVLPAHVVRGHRHVDG